ncbi:hypothetical protein ACLBX9_29955 [Methylobacterium sp. A49B]
MRDLQSIRDREVETPETVLPVVATDIAIDTLPEATILPWRGRGNIVAAVGVALLDLAGVR